MVATWSASLQAQVDPPVVNACEFLTAAEVSTATGLPAQAGSRRDAGPETNGAYSSTCIWVLDREDVTADPMAPLGGRSFVILNVMRWPDGSGRADSFLQAFRDAADIGEIPRQPAARDFGDAALWWGDGLAVREDDVAFGVSVWIPGHVTDRPGEIEELLAPAILQRLER